MEKTTLEYLMGTDKNLIFNLAVESLVDI